MAINQVTAHLPPTANDYSKATLAIRHCPSLVHQNRTKFDQDELANQIDRYLKLGHRVNTYAHDF